MRKNIWAAVEWVRGEGGPALGPQLLDGARGWEFCARRGCLAAATDAGNGWVEVRVNRRGEIVVAEARTNSFGHRAKLFLASTPTVTGASRIEREYQLSDQRRYHVPCPHCGALQWLQFERLRWDKGQPETAHYVCEHCEEPIEERFKSKRCAQIVAISA